MSEMPRVLIFDHADQPLMELAAADVFGLVRTEKINGEHSLQVTTTTILQKEMRILTCDMTGKWREWVVTGEDQDHTSGLSAIGTYYCTWSLQHDLALTKVDTMPGVQEPVAASVALEAALGGTARWTVGTVTRATYGGASMWYKSGWEALSIVVETWGGEVDATIEVGTSGVVSRSVDLYDMMGEQTAKRRFDWSYDLKGIKRNVDDAPVAVRIIPRGKGEETDNGGYGRKITIESVNDGVEWLQNDDVAELYRLPDGNGGWEYPTVIAENGSIEEPQALKEWGLSVIEDYTVPRVTYSGEVMQLAQAGMDPQGIDLGDATQCVDRGFCDEGLRVSGRVVAMVVNELDRSDISLTIGYLASTLSDKFRNVSKIAATVSDMNGGTFTTADYLNALLTRLNGEINATGGYTYIVQGSGIRTYDVAVSDPLVGAEATKVVEIKGGTVRIADSRTAQGEWDWRSVFEAGRIATDMVVGGQIQTGYIRNADGSFYVDLDGHVVNIGASPMMGDTALADALDDARRYATDYLHYEGGELTLGTIDSAVKNVMTSSRQAFRTDEGDIAWYGLDSTENIWKFFIQNAQVTDMLQFGGFAWIARQNGNMTIKWVGE